MTALCANMELKRPTAQSFIELLETTHLIYRLPPLGYGKDILRGRFKIYLADAAIAPAVMLKGKSILEDPAALGVATETAVFKHLFAHYYAQNVRFSYWRGKKDREVDLVAEIAGEIIPFEVKYRAQHTGLRDLQGLLELCQNKSVDRAYVVTKALDDFGPLQGLPTTNARVMRIPAPCFATGWANLNSIPVSDTRTDYQIPRTQQVPAPTNDADGYPGMNAQEPRLTLKWAAAIISGFVVI